MKICFVILHYLTYKDTDECIESILNNQDYENKEIIVVDNGSNNGSYELLEEKYSDNPSIHLIKSDINLGFAKGNNLGFSFAKKELNADFIILINNDTLVNQKDFCKQVITKYKQYNYSVLGPDIHTLDNVHQNPYFRDALSLKQCKRIIIKQYIHLFLTYLGLDELISKKINHDSIKKISGDVLDVPLHGACLIFSKNYINEFDGLDNRTFLYFEEDILRLYCKNKNLLMMYSGDLVIEHKEDIASQAMHPKKRAKKIFIYTQRLKSAKVYKEIWKELNINEKRK